MKILLPTSSFPRTPTDGRGRFVLEYIFSVLNKGHKITVLAPTVEESNFLDNSRNLQIFSFRYSPSSSLERYFSEMTLAEMVKRTFIGKLFLPLYTINQTKRIANLIQAERFDLIHSQWMLAEMNAQIAKMLIRSKIPSLVTVHGADMSISERNIITRQVFLKVSNMTDIVLANSNYTKNRLIRLGVQSDKIHLQYQGINPEAFDAIGVNKKDPNLVLFVGRLSQRKGVKYLLKAFKKVIQSSKDVKLVIVGIGPEYQNLVMLSKKLGINENIEFIRIIKREELLKLFKTASIFVIPSVMDEFGETETLGVVLIEASYCKTPIVASEVGGIPEIVDHGLTGLLVKPGDSDGLALSILKLLEDPQLRINLGNAGKKKVLNQFTWAQISDNTIKIYENLVSKF